MCNAVIVYHHLCGATADPLPSGSCANTPAQDPAMRMWLVDTRSYLPPVQIGETMRANGLGRIVATRSDRFKVGDLVHGTLGWQEYWVGPARVLEARDTPPGGKEIDHLGFLGVSGMTAYFVSCAARLRVPAQQRARAGWGMGLASAPAPS